MRLDKRVKALLDECELPWEIVNGRKHFKLFVSGRFVAVIPHSLGSANARGGVYWFETCQAIRKRIKTIQLERRG